MTRPRLVRRALAFVPLVAGAAACALPAHAADLMMAGEYEWTTKTNDDEARTFKSCVTPEMTKLTNGDSRSGREAAEKAGKGRCTIQAYDVVGTKVSSRMTCGDRVLTSAVTYHGDTSEGDLTVSTAAGGAHVDRMHTAARRLGACK